MRTDSLLKEVRSKVMEVFIVLGVFLKRFDKIVCFLSPYFVQKYAYNNKNMNLLTFLLNWRDLKSVKTYNNY